MTPRKKAAKPEAPVIAEPPSDESLATLLGDQIVAFHLGGQRYALPIDRVREIQQIVAFAEMPSSDDAVIGMVNLRGVVIPALDMRLLVGLERIEYELDTPMIICATSDGSMVAIVVDDVEDVISIPEHCLSEPPKLHTLSSRLLGVCHLGTELVFVLDVDKLVAPIDLNLPGGGSE